MATTSSECRTQRSTFPSLDVSESCVQSPEFKRGNTKGSFVLCLMYRNQKRLREKGPTCPLPLMRSSPQRVGGSRRLARAAPRQVVCCVHAGNESDLVSRSQTSNAGPYERTRYKGDIPGSCFAAVTARRWRGLAGIGIRRRHAKGLVKSHSGGGATVKIVTVPHSSYSERTRKPRSGMTRDEDADN